MTDLLTGWAVDLAASGASASHIERLLIVALQFCDGDTDQLHHAISWANEDHRAFLLLRGYELTDWHSYLEWEPTPQLWLDLAQPLSDLIDACNLEVYEVAADNIIRWCHKAGLPTALLAVVQLEAALAAVDRHDGLVVGDSSLLYHTWVSVADCLAYFETWRREISVALVEVGGPEVVDPCWLTPTVRGLVAGAVADRGFDRLPVLADALEEVGCDSRLVLDHLRGPGDHGPFCWVTDLLAAAG